MKKFLLFLFFAVMLFFACYKPSKINLEGDWTLEQMLFDGKEVFNYHPKEEFTFTISPYFDLIPQVKINNWNDSINIFNQKKQLRASLKILNENTKPYVMMGSKDKSLNGKFELKIDTIKFSKAEPGRYRIKLELVSKDVYIHLSREVYPKPPQKVPLPRRGAI